MVFPDCIDVGCSLSWNISAVYWRFGIQILQLINVYSSLAVLSTANREVPGWTRVSPVIAIICMAQRFFRAVQTHSIYLRFVHVYSVAWSLGGEGRRGQKWLCHTGISCSSTLYVGANKVLGCDRSCPEKGSPSYIPPYRLWIIL